MIECPTNAKLSGLIQGLLPEQETDQLTDHLASCNQCQDSLQSIASGELPIENLAANCSDIQPPTDSAYWNVVNEINPGVNVTQAFQAPEQYANQPLKTTPNEGNQETRWDQDAPSTGKPEFSFLEPSDDPAFLGKLHHFQISRVLGRGGMGIVLEGFDTHLHRRVAIKVLNPQFQQNDLARQRFCREGRAAAAISHEHVVPMHQVSKSEDGSIAFLVMQLIDGETLEERLNKSAPLPAAEVARIGMQIAAGLSAAHANDMVHRDIKPANVLIERDSDRVKLTDFGLARAADDVKLTQTGMVTGTPLYMSPEQALGNSPDERSDLFSLGAVMYEMATGISPFQAPSAVGVMKKIMDENPQPPRKINQDIGKPLSDMIVNLVSKSPDDRPDSAADVARVLASIVTEYGPISPLQVPAVASTEVKRLSGKHQSIKDRWSVAGWATAATLFLALSTVFLIWMNQTPNATTEVLANNGRVAINDGQEFRTKSAESFPSVVLPDNPGTVWAVDFAPDGKTIVAAIEDGSVRVWDIASKTVLRSFSAHRGIVWSARFHPKLDLVATTGDDGLIKLWDSNTFELVKEWKVDNSVRGIAFSPDHQSLVAGDREGKIHVYDIASGEKTRTHSQPGSILSIDYSSDGKLVATVGSDKVVRVFDSENFEPRQTFTGHEGPIYNVKFAPNSPLLASVGWGSNIRVWNVETGAEVSAFDGGGGDVWGIEFCGAGTHLVTGSHDGTARVWELATETNTAILSGHSSAVHDIELDPTCHRIATSSRDGTIRVWDMSELQH